MEILQKLQKIELKILADVDKICDENNLTYYIIGGTLLGAVRHGGFIPWDDDIDIVMYREDYNKLIEILQKAHKDKYFIQTFDTDPYYTRYVAKVRLKGTVLIEKSQSKSKSKGGVYIDIFPLDNVRHRDSIDLRLRGMMVRCLFAYKTIRYHSESSTSKIKLFLSKFLRIITYLLPRKFANRLFDYVCSKDNGKNCKYTTNFASHYKWKKQMFGNEVYGDGCRLNFEGYSFNAPKDYNKVLEQIFGKDYMKLPPEEKRICHNIYKLDLGEYEKMIYDVE